MSKYQDKDLRKYSEIFKALSHPNRLKIFLRLISCCKPGTVWDMGCTCVGDLGADLDIGSSTMSHHIKELRQAGLIRMSRKGQKIECSIDPDALEELRTFLNLESQ